MTSLFRLMLKMSITASYVIVFVLMLRLLLRRFPRKYSYYLWSAVLFRLCCPFSFSSVLSIFNISAKRGENVIIDLSGVPVSPSAATEGTIGSIDLGSPFITEVVKETFIAPEQSIMVNPAAPQPAAPVITPVVESATHTDFLTILTTIWLLGTVIMAGYALVSYIRVKKEVALAEPIDDIVAMADIRSPFLLGLVNPTIYFPFDIEESVFKMSLAHERYHLQRKDNWIRVLSYCMLCIYWMNPLCWLAFFLMIRDMEMSCDEYVLSQGEDIRALYSDALISLSTKKAGQIITTITFGSNDVKKRVLNIMHYKTASKLISLVGKLLCVIALIFCISNGNVNAALGSAEYSHEDVIGSVAETIEEDLEFDPIRVIGKPIGGIIGSPAKTMHGYYEINRWNNTEFGNIIYTDYASQETRFLCNEPGCFHNTPNCTSYIPYPSGTQLFTDYAENHLYLMYKGTEGDEEVAATPGVIIEMNMDGTEKRTVCELPPGEHFDTNNIVISGNNYMYALIKHTGMTKKAFWDYDTGTEVVKEVLGEVTDIERIWFKDGKREKIKQLINNGEVFESLLGTDSDKYITVQCLGYSHGDNNYIEIIDQNGEIVGTRERIQDGYVDLGSLYIKIEVEGGIATVAALTDSGGKRTITGIPYTSTNPAWVFSCSEDRVYMQYIWIENGIDQERAFILDFADCTWKEFTLRRRSNNHYFITPLAETNEDYLVLINRFDTVIVLKDANGEPRTYDYYGCDTYALMTKEDFWNSISNYRTIEEKFE